jgi:D-alanyl-D-alanine-carboxypeptidase/D-alanyl-D-alanine-endopeptidase
VGAFGRRRLLGALGAVTCAFSAIAAPARALAPADAAPAEQAMFVDSRAPGMVVVIVKGAAETIRGYGETRPGGGVKPDARTLFRLGSVSKLFADDLMVDLRHDRRLELSDDVERYDPYGAAPRTPPITLLSLATHTSGMPRSAPAAARAGPDPKGARWAWLRAHPRLAAPGRGAVYSNFAYDLLGDALASAGRTPFEAQVLSRLAIPLGMTETVYAPDPAQCARLMLARRPRDLFPCAPEHAVAASGGLYSTAADMAAYMRWRLGLGGPPDPERAVRDAVFVRRQDLAWAQGLDIAGQADGVGLGWLRLAQPPGAPRILEKTGGFEGFNSYLAIVPGRGVGVFVVYDRMDLPALGRVAARVNALALALAEPG